MYAWAHWLADALRSDPFIAPRVIEVDGWQTRGRGPELGFSFLPSGILDHHTACMCRIGHDPQSCLNGILAGNGLAPPPVSQLLGTFTKPGTRWTGSNPDPHIIVVAAGRCNHAGAGVWPWGAPAGNGSAIGIEWCGPPDNGWPDIVVALREHVDAAILRWNGWTTQQLTTHWEYVQPVRPGAKIDPSGAWYAEGSLEQTEHWDPALWRDMVAITMKPPDPEPEPPPDEEDDMDGVKVYIGRDKRDGRILLSLGGVCYRRVQPGADENGVRSRMQFGVGPEYYDPRRKDEQVTVFGEIPVLDGAWVVAMGVELAESTTDPTD